MRILSDKSPVKNVRSETRDSGCDRGLKSNFLLTSLFSTNTREMLVGLVGLNYYVEPYKELDMILFSRDLMINARGAVVDLPLNFLLWGYVIAYCVHIVEEYASGDGFVAMMRKHFWPEYTARMFFGFNAMLLLILGVGLIVFDTFGGMWVVWPLSFAFFFVTNGLWHLVQTIVLKEYSAGLISSPIYWVIMYFIVRYYFLIGEIDLIPFSSSIVIGSITTLLMLLYLRSKTKQKGRLLSSKP